MHLIQFQDETGARAVAATEGTTTSVVTGATSVYELATEAALRRPASGDAWQELIFSTSQGHGVSAGDAFLVLDKGTDKVIDRFDEISFTGYLPGARTDLEGLAAFDSNGDGKTDQVAFYDGASSPRRVEIDGDFDGNSGGHDHYQRSQLCPY